MIVSKIITSPGVVSAVLSAALMSMSPTALATDPVTETVKHSFAGSDGEYPSFGAPTLGLDGNLYGVTQQGGAHQLGAIYRLARDGTETVLYSFQGNGDGIDPTWSLARDAKGNFYGMTAPDTSATNHGTVFKITPAGVFATLHAFPLSGADGWASDNAVTVGSDGYLYGITFEGGSNGVGTFFRLNTDGSNFTVLYNFATGHQAGAAAAYYPQAGVVQGSDGNFYGLATGYDLNQYGAPGNGAVYRITPTGVMTVLYGFIDGSMETAIGMPTLDAAGNLYFYGDIRNYTMTGRIYKLDTSNVLSTLHQFTIQEGVPAYSGQLLLGKDARLYGTTYWGGPTGGWDAGPGTVFSLGLDGVFAVLHNFGIDVGDGANPQAGLVAARDGSLWGTTRIGGTLSNGTAYRLSKPTVRFSVYPSTIAVGQTTKLKWSSTNTTSCVASGSWGPGSEPISGTQMISVAVAGTYSFTLNCSGAGSKSRSVKLTVN